MENVTLATNLEEQALESSVSAYEEQAALVTITNDADYAAAADMLKPVKQLMKQIKAYWNPLLTKAKDAYDDVRNRQKAMLEPLEKTEAILKGKMSAFDKAKIEEEKRKQEALRLLAKKAADEALESAISFEKDGDAEGAEYAMVEAETMDDLAGTEIGPVSRKNVDGIGRTKTWKIKSIDPALVPISVDGVCIRPVDESAVKRLIKASKGTIQIPGVVYEEEYTISVRA